MYAQPLISAWMGMALTPLLLFAWSERKEDLDYSKEDFGQPDDRSNAQKVNRGKQKIDQLASLYQAIDHLSKMQTEDELIDRLLALCVEFSGAVGGTYIAYDARKQPQKGYFQLGEAQNLMLDAYFEYIASPQVRGRCAVCLEKETLRHSCPLIYDLDDIFDKTTRVFCLPMERLGKEYGVINLSFNSPAYPGPREIEQLKHLARLGAAFLSSLRANSQAQNLESYLAEIGGEDATDHLLEQLLHMMNVAFNSRFSCLKIHSQTNYAVDITVGNPPRNIEKLIDAEWKGRNSSCQSNGIQGNEKIIHQTIGVIDVLIFPFGLSNGEALIGIGYASGNDVLCQRIEESMSHIASVVKQILDFRAQSSNAVIGERTRLAREIHDGVAQNLGFLKLKLAQMKKYLDQNKLSDLENALLMAYQVTTESYLDIREAIDGLRENTVENNFIEWLESIADSFHQNTGVVTRLTTDIEKLYITPETHLQLIRIVQEALSNVRKHAQASRVELLCNLVENQVWLEVIDNGKGFSPADSDLQSHHGLQGIKERAELVGAKFQVVSHPGEGTKLQVQLPADKIMYCQ